jgi:hypothetical protein
MAHYRIIGNAWVIYVCSDVINEHERAESAVNMHMVLFIDRQVAMAERKRRWDYGTGDPGSIPGAFFKKNFCVPLGVWGRG